ncbi:MAG: porin [Cardiobacteriaceae bacterium]|nr:porin [Cardiobacteriaceae bacterium]
MKKSLIALGVAAGMFGVAHADTTNLYGALGFSMSVTDSEAGFKDNVWDLAKHTSRFGIKGTEDLSNGLQAFFKFELDVDPEGDWKDNMRSNPKGANGTRFAYIGLKGDFGTLTLGRQNSLWKTVMDQNNFNDVFTSAAGIGKLGRVSKAVSYVSPAFSGFQFAGSAIFDGANPATKGADAYEVAALYDNYGVNAGVVYSNIKVGTGRAKDTTELTGLNVGYKMDDTFSVNFGAAHKSSAGERYNLQGEYFLGANTFRAGVNYDDNKGKGASDPLTAALGYQYNFSKRTYVWVEGEYTDYDVKGKDNGYQVFVGARHNF